MRWGSAIFYALWHRHLTPETPKAPFDFGTILHTVKQAVGNLSAMPEVSIFSREQCESVIGTFASLIGKSAVTAHQ